MSSLLSENKNKLSIMSDHIKNILITVSKNPVTNVVSSSGSGKTTQLPRGISEAGNKIMVVVKDENIATSLENYTESVDDIIYISQNNFKNYLYKLLNNGSIDLDFVDILMIDEADVQTVDQYIIMSIWRFCTEKGGKIPRLLLASNTKVETNLFETSVYDISQDRYPVTVRYLGDNLYNDIKDNVSDYAIDLIYNIYQGDINGNTLIFATDSEEINYIVDVLSKMDLGNTEIIGVHRNPPQNVLDKIYEQSLGSKIVITDSLGETSISVDSLFLIVDLMTDMIVHQSLTGGMRIKRKHISKSKASVRSNRGGKSEPVLSYRLISEAMFNRLDESDTPEIYRTPIHKIIIDLLKNNINPYDILMGLDQEYISKSYNLMLDLGLIDIDQVTKMGDFVNSLPYGVRQGSILFKWLQLYPEESNKIVPILSMIDVFEKPFWVYPMIQNNMTQTEYKLLLLDHYKKYFMPFEGKSDIHTFVKFWRIMQDEIGINPNYQDLMDWCIDNSINHDNMETVMALNDFFNTTPIKMELDIMDTLGPIIKNVYSDRKLIKDRNPHRVLYLGNDNNLYSIDSRYGLNSIEKEIPAVIYGVVTSNINSGYSNFNTVALSLI